MDDVMFVVTIEDAIAIHRAHQQAGEDAALAEVRRRWLGLADHVHRNILGKVLRMKVEVPKPVTDRAPPSPGAAPDDDKVRRDAERRRVRQRERDDARRARMKAD